MREIEIVAHRAGPVRAGAPRHAEQTLGAFRDSWTLEGVACELDVRLTRDQVPVAFHDATLQRITGRRGRLGDLDLAGFRALRADVVGADRHLARAPRPVPLATLDDVLTFARGSGAHLVVELKNLPGDPAFDATPRTAELVAERIGGAGIPPHRLTVQSFRAADVAVLGARLPGVRRSLLVRPGEAGTGVPAAEGVGAHAVGLAWPVSAREVAAGHARGLVVMTYTVNDAAAVRAAAHAGVDAIITDDPALARDALTPAPPPVATAWRRTGSSRPRGVLESHECSPTARKRT